MIPDDAGQGSRREGGGLVVIIIVIVIVIIIVILETRRYKNIKTNKRAWWT